MPSVAFLRALFDVVRLCVVASNAEPRSLRGSRVLIVRSAVTKTTTWRPSAVKDGSEKKKNGSESST